MIHTAIAYWAVPAVLVGAFVVACAWPDRSPRETAEPERCQLEYLFPGPSQELDLSTPETVAAVADDARGDDENSVTWSGWWSR